MFPVYSEAIKDALALLGGFSIAGDAGGQHAAADAPWHSPAPQRGILAALIVISSAEHIQRGSHPQVFIKTGPAVVSGEKAETLDRSGILQCMRQNRTDATETPETPVQETTPQPAKPEPPAQVADGNFVDDVIRLKHEYESKKDAAIAELLKERTLIENRLAELGYTREPDFVPVPASRVESFRKAKAAKSKKFCPICTTDPEKPVLGHDGRRHKSQKRKRPFTEAELAGR